MTHKQKSTIVVSICENGLKTAYYEAINLTIQ